MADPSNSLRLDKRNDAVFPQIEDDVSELDQLRNEPSVVNKRQHDGGSTVRTTTTTKESVEKVIAAPDASSSKELQQAGAQQLLPDLERQLEVATPLMSMSTTTTTSTSATTTTAAFKDESERSQLEEPKTAAKPAPEQGVHAKVSSEKGLVESSTREYRCCKEGVEWEVEEGVERRARKK